MTNFIIIFLFVYLSVKGTSHRYKSHCIEAGTASRTMGHTLVSCRLLMSLQISHTLMPTANIFLAHIAIEAVCVMLEARDKREVRLSFRIKLGPVSSRTFRSLQLLWWRCLAPGFRIVARHYLSHDTRSAAQLQVLGAIILCWWPKRVQRLFIGGEDPPSMVNSSLAGQKYFARAVYCTHQ